MSLARGLRLLLTVALLAAWQSALLHPLKHVDRAGALVHVPGQDHGKGKSEPLCDAIAAVAACVSGSQPLALAAAVVSDPVAASAGENAAAPRLAYRSQAPPTLL